MTPAQKKWIDGEGRKLGYQMVGVTGALSVANLSMGGYSDQRWISRNGEVRTRKRDDDDMPVGKRIMPNPGR